MSELTLRDIKKIIVNVGLDAEYRVESKFKWADVINQAENVPVFFMEHYVNYQTVIFNHLSDSSKDISLILYNDKRPCGIWPLVFDIKNKEPIKSINNHYGGIVIPPLFIKNFPKKSQRKVIKKCIEFLNELLVASNRKYWRTNELSLNGDISQWNQILLEMGAILDKVNYEMFVDLSLPIKQIRSSIRKSFRPLVSSGLKNWNVTVMDKYNEKSWNKFIKLHKKVAGRVTRSIESWNIQHEAIRSGDAFLVYVSSRKGDMVGGGYFDMSDQYCNYSVGSYDKDFSHEPLGHMVQYQAILTMKEKGKKIYYLGDRFYKEDLPSITKKRVDISYFQQGFSSKVFPRMGLLFSLDEKINT